MSDTVTIALVGGFVTITTTIVAVLSAVVLKRTAGISEMHEAVNQTHQAVNHTAADLVVSNAAEKARLELENARLRGQLEAFMKPPSDSPPPGS